MMRLVFVNRFYWPEAPATGQLLTDLAEGLATAGHEVVVVTSAADAAAPRRERHHDVTIQRIRGTRWAHRGLAGKAIDFATFYLGAAWRVLRAARRGSVVVAMTDPPLLGIGIDFAAGLRGARVVHWVQDIYPEIAVALTGHAWLRALAPLRNRAWRRADACVTLGQDMADVLLDAGVWPGRVAVIPNWGPAGLAATSAGSAAVRAAWQVRDRFVVAYSGNLGRVHDLGPLLDVADALREDRSIVFVLVGDGAQRAMLVDEAARRRLPNVAFQPAQPRALLGDSLAAADLHLVTLRPGCERFVFPSKLYGIAAVGRPILCLAPRRSEIARLVVEHQLGHAAQRDEVDDVVRFIRKLVHDPAAREAHAAATRRFAQMHDVTGALARWKSLLCSLDACGAIPAGADTGHRS